jgi:hypothetical protein
MAKRYQRGNQNSHIKQEQTNQWPKEVLKDKQRSTKHSYTYNTNPTKTDQLQASDQFLTTIKLATNKAICLKTAVPALLVAPVVF